MNSKTIGRLLRLYPASWRARYGDEYTALLETQPTSASVVIDVLAGAASAHVRAAFSPHRWDVLRQELGYAVRGIRRGPGFAAAVALTLGLGIGANTAMFSVVDRLLFRPPAFLRDGARVHRAYFATMANGKEHQAPNIAYRRYLEITRWTSSFDRTAAAFHPMVAIGVGDDAREMRVGAVSASLFDFFEAKPAAGRFFSEKEDAVPSGAPVVVLSHGFWQTRYGGRSSVIGERLHIGPIVYTVIGIAPPDFVGVSEWPLAAFIPITSYAAEMLDDRNNTEYYTTYSSRWMEMLVRRKPNVPVETATADMTAAYRQSFDAERVVASQLPPTDVARPRVVVGPLLHERGPNQTTASKLATWLVGVTGIVLLIACANVANLLLARALVRRREIAVRVALGVSRARLLVQLFSESVLLAVLGGAVAVAVAHWGGKALSSSLLPNASAASTVGDIRGLLFTGGAVLFAGFLIGLAPVLQLSRVDVVSGLKGGVRDGAHRSPARLALQIAQVALSLILLVGSGLFVRSLLNVRGQRLGYDVDPILYVEMAMRNETLTVPELASLKRRVLAVAQSLPGVESAARVTTVPFYGSSSSPIFVSGIDTSVINRMGEFLRQNASPEIFATTGTRIIRGRAFTAADIETTPRVAVVTDAMARALWPAQDAIGKCFRAGGEKAPCTTVIGISENIRAHSLEGDGALLYFIPIEQRAPAGGGFFVRTRGAGRDHAESVRRDLQRLMPGTSYVTVTPFSNIIGFVVRSWRLGAILFTVFGVLALVLAAIGLYGVIAHSVAQRTHELGVRVALGARRRDVLRLVVGEGVRIGVAGVLIGGGIALTGARWIAPLLFNQSPRDPLVFAIVIVTILTVAMVASVVPARRATNVDPNVALRAE